MIWVLAKLREPDGVASHWMLQELWLVALVCSWHHKGFGTGLSTLRHTYTQNIFFSPHGPGAVAFEADFGATWPRQKHSQKENWNCLFHRDKNTSTGRGQLRNETHVEREWSVWAPSPSAESGRRSYVQWCLTTMIRQTSGPFRQQR